MNAFTVVIDACVLYPAPIRDLVMNLAVAGLFRARWTDRMHDEWIGSLLRDRADLTPEKLARTRANMDRSLVGCLVTGYEDFIDSLSLPDPDDRHVLAAAIRCRADLIVTYNLKDFPAETLKQYDIEAQHPDTFLLNQFSLDQATVLKAVHQHRASLKNPQKKSLEYLGTLGKQGLPLFVATLRPFADVL